MMSFSQRPNSTPNRPHPFQHNTLFDANAIAHQSWLQQQSFDRDFNYGMNAHKQQPSSQEWQLFPSYYDHQQAQWKNLKTVDEICHVTCMMHQGMPSQLRILTFNIWFDPYMMKERMDGLMSEIFPSANNNLVFSSFPSVGSNIPDVLCFQEVTTQSLEMIAQHPMIRNNYYLSDSPDDAFCSVYPYGVLMAVKKTLPIRKLFYNTMPSKMNRAALSVEIGNSQYQHENIIVTTVHLESLSNADLRFQQLDVIANFQIPYSHAIICGDFNFDSERNYDENYLPYLENSYLTSNAHLKQYQDVWKMLKYPNDLGKTFDTTANAMLAKCSHEVMRYDRVLLKSFLIPSRHTQLKKYWKPIHIELLGTKPIGYDQNRKIAISISDHFGILTVMENAQMV
ncbi:hypothetical protein C9374_014158 [Naegleria lovaniensis]|uniref:Endonuclease/exonuclease/phosphatase domain-containing protein n=1 Tax=Naegleria lovaniensis TaxID=51637 RepID=A0AA88H031_NAELO|nr:uncharacterized protein C9374_014158 [Naegleria lovaniensis]KAG2389598.1 hypothetical protein C9374_014158 [Naegleria lovaniensis]